MPRRDVQCSARPKTTSKYVACKPNLRDKSTSVDESGGAPLVDVVVVAAAADDDAAAIAANALESAALDDDDSRRRRLAIDEPKETAEPSHPLPFSAGRTKEEAEEKVVCCCLLFIPFFVA